MRQLNLAALSTSTAVTRNTYNDAAVLWIRTHHIKEWNTNRNYFSTLWVIMMLTKPILPGKSLFFLCSKSEFLNLEPVKWRTSSDVLYINQQWRRRIQQIKAWQSIYGIISMLQGVCVITITAMRGWPKFHTALKFNDSIYILLFNVFTSTFFGWIFGITQWKSNKKETVCMRVNLMIWWFIAWPKKDNIFFILIFVKNADLKWFKLSTSVMWSFECRFLLVVECFYIVAKQQLMNLNIFFLPLFILYLSFI